MKKKYDLADMALAGLMGAGVAMMLTILCGQIINRSFTSELTALQSAHSACAQYQQAAVSFDRAGDVLCSGGIEINYKRGGK